jgi:hypothetical protein
MLVKIRMERGEAAMLTLKYLGAIATHFRSILKITELKSFLPKDEHFFTYKDILFPIVDSNSECKRNDAIIMVVRLQVIGKTTTEESNLLEKNTIDG